jgi:hypothetical protein
MFETAFSSGDDDLIADAVSVWAVDGDQAPPGLCVHYLADRMKRDKPFSLRLRRVTIHVIACILHSELNESGLETVCLLNHLEVDVDDIVVGYEWAWLLAEVLCSPIGLESLSSHYWCLLGKLALGESFSYVIGSRKMEVMGSLEEAEDWEKLEVWMVVVWQSLYSSPRTSPTKDIERVTLKLLLQRASALPRFKALCKYDSVRAVDKVKLQQICDRVQVEQLSSESPPLQYVSVRPDQSILSDATFCLLSQSVHAQANVPLRFARSDTF